jgi:hypothetical protein
MIFELKFSPRPKVEATQVKTQVIAENPRKPEGAVSGPLKGHFFYKLQMHATSHPH